MNDALPKIPCRYEGEGSFAAATPHWQRIADKHFVIGEVYDLQHEEARSRASHNHYFAELTDAWHNLPERWAERLPTPEHLRAYALIRTGYADTRTFVARSTMQAREMRDFMRPIDPFSIVQADVATVTIWTAQSQSMRAMGKEKFQASKTAVLEFVAALIEVAPAELSANAARAA